MLSGLLWLVDSCEFVLSVEGEGSRIPIDFGFVGAVAGVEVLGSVVLTMVGVQLEFVWVEVN